MFFWKNKNKKSLGGKTVMAFGTFDLLHAGHENFLKQAKENGEQLIVILARDKTVRSVKGRSPMNKEKIRLKNLRQTGWANQVELGNLKDKYKIIIKHEPDIIALGYDQFVFTQSLPRMLIESRLDTEIVRTTPYYPQVYKSSLLRKEQPKVDSQTTVIKTVKPTANYN